MKLRLRGNSVRIRLTQSEVQSLNQQGWWEEKTALGPLVTQRLVYRVESGAGPLPHVALSSDGASATVMVILPRAQVTAWAHGSDVGIYFEELWGLKVAVEKDFRCLDEQRDEDESDNFDHPHAALSLHAVCHAD